MLSVGIDGWQEEVAVSPLGREAFAGRNCLVTLSRNNDLRWIRDWAAFHVREHGAEALLLFDGQPQGAYDKALEFVTELFIPPGVYWAVAVQDGSDTGVTPMEMDWCDGFECGYGDALQLAFDSDTSGAWGMGTWIDAWDADIDTTVRYAPAIRPVGEV